MNVLVREVINSIFFGASSKVAVSVKESLLISINGCQKAIASDIELSVIYQKRFFNIFLNNHRPAIIALKL